MTTTMFFCFPKFNANGFYTIILLRKMFTKCLLYNVLTLHVLAFVVKCVEYIIICFIVKLIDFIIYYYVFYYGIY